jgi:CRP-like cAMP-binding protein
LDRNRKNNSLRVKNIDQIRKQFEQIVPIPDKDWEAFTAQLVRREFAKKTIILHEGQTENYISFIEEGIIRFFIPKEGNELTFSFIFNDEMLCAYDSFLTRSPSLYAAETITHTILWSFTYADLQKLYKEVPLTNIIGRIASEEIYLKKAKREISLLNDSAEERYLKIFSDKRNLINFIPLKFLASFIGITPQALSRIRKRIS